MVGIDRQGGSFDALRRYGVGSDFPRGGIGVVTERGEQPVARDRGRGVPGSRGWRARRRGRPGPRRSRQSAVDGDDETGEHGGEHAGHQEAGEPRSTGASARTRCRGGRARIPRVGPERAPNGIGGVAGCGAGVPVKALDSSCVLVRRGAARNSTAPDRSRMTEQTSRAGTPAAAPTRTAALHAQPQAHRPRGRAVDPGRAGRGDRHRRFPHPPALRDHLARFGDAARLVGRADRRRADLPRRLRQRALPHRPGVDERAERLARGRGVARSRPRGRGPQLGAGVSHRRAEPGVQHRADGPVAERRQVRRAHAPRLLGAGEPGADPRSSRCAATRPRTTCSRPAIRCSRSTAPT